jgi:ABC-type Fe3+ transport system permease subunit
VGRGRGRRPPRSSRARCGPASPTDPPLFLAGPRLTTLPVQIFNYLEYTSDPTIAAISVVLVLITTVAVLVTERIVGFGRFV